MYLFFGHTYARFPLACVRQASGIPADVGCRNKASCRQLACIDIDNVLRLLIPMCSLAALSALACRIQRLVVLGLLGSQFSGGTLKSSQLAWCEVGQCYVHVLLLVESVPRLLERLPGRGAMKVTRERNETPPQYQIVVIMILLLFLLCLIDFVFFVCLRQRLRLSLALCSNSHSLRCSEPCVSMREPSILPQDHGVLDPEWQYKPFVSIRI